MPFHSEKKVEIFSHFYLRHRQTKIWRGVGLVILHCQKEVSCLRCVRANFDGSAETLMTFFPEEWRECEEGGKGKQETNTTFRFQGILLIFFLFLSLSFFSFLGKWNWFLQQNCDCQTASAYDFLHWIYHKWHLWYFPTDGTFHHLFLICESLPRSVEWQPRIKTYLSGYIYISM